MAASLTFDSAYRQVRRGQLAPVYYLTGDEDVLKDELVSLIIERAVGGGDPSFSVDVRAAGELDGEKLHTLVETLPLLTERRAVVVKNPEQWRKTAPVWDVLERYLTAPAPTTVLILVQGAGAAPDRELARRVAHVTVAPLPPHRLARWIALRAERVGLALEPGALEHLVSALGSDLAILGLELERLAAAAPEGHALSATEIARLVGVRRGQTPHDWVAAVVERDLPRAAGMLDSVLAAPAATGVRLVAALGAALLGVGLARSLLDRGMPPARVEHAVFEGIRAARLYGLGKWRDEAAAWTRAARHWSPPELDHAVRAAAEADAALKSTTVSDDRGILLSLVLGLARPRAAA